MKNLHLVFIAVSLVFTAAAVSACPSPPQHLRAVESKADLTRPMDSRGHYTIFEFDKNGKEISKTYSEEEIVEVREHEEKSLFLFSVSEKKNSKQSCKCCKKKHEYTVRERFGYKDKDGKVVIKPIFQNAYEFKGRYAGVRLNKRWFFIDQTGKRTSPDFEFVSHYSDGLAAVKVAKNKWIYIDERGNPALDLTFDREREFSEGLVSVYTKHGCGYVNKKGEYEIEPKFASASEFKNGRAIVGMHRLNDGSYVGFGHERYMYGLIDKTGKYVLEPGFDKIEIYDGGKSKACLVNYDSLRERQNLWWAYYLNYRYKKGFDYKHPEVFTMTDAVELLDELFSDKLKEKIRSSDQAVMTKILQGTEEDFIGLFGLDKDGHLKSYFKAKKIIDPRKMVAEVLDAYWLKLQKTEKLSSTESTPPHLH